MIKTNIWGDDFLTRLLATVSSSNGLNPQMTMANTQVSRPASLVGTWRGTTTDKNTAIRVTGIEGVAYHGSNYILYNRIGLGVINELRGDFSKNPIQIGAIKRKSELVAYLNRYFGYGLKTTDIVDGDVVTPTDGSTFTVHLDPIADHYQFNAGYDFICQATGAVATQTVKKVDLSGLLYPSADLTAQQAYIATYPISFTPEFATLSKLTVDSGVDQKICDILVKYVNAGFTLAAGDYSLSGAKIKYAALNSPAVAANSAYKYVVTIQLSNDSVKMRGLLILQFNEPFDLTVPPSDTEIIPG